MAIAITQTEESAELILRYTVLLQKCYHHIAFMMLGIFLCSHKYIILSAKISAA